MASKYFLNKDISLILFVVFFLYIFFCYMLFKFTTLTLVILFGILLIKFSQSFKDFFNLIVSYIKIKNVRAKNVLAFLLTLFSIGLILNLFALSFTDLSQSLSDAIEKKPLRDYFLAFSSNLQERSPFIYENTIDKIKGEDVLNFLEENVISVSTSFFSEFFNFLFMSLIIIPLIFTTKKKLSVKKLSKTFFSKFDDKISKILENMLLMIGHDLNNFLKAKVKQTLIITLVSSIGFFLIGLKGWFVLGFFVGLINIIPFFGPLIGLIVTLFFGLSQSIQVGLFALGVIVLVQIIDNFYIQPVLIPKLISIDSLLSVILTLIGVGSFGTMGLILFVPMYLALRIILREVYLGLMKIYE